MGNAGKKEIEADMLVAGQLIDSTKEGIVPSAVDMMDLHT